MPTTAPQRSHVRRVIIPLIGVNSLLILGLGLTLFNHPTMQPTIAPKFYPHPAYVGIKGRDYNWHPDTNTGNPRATYSISQGHLPPGLELNARDGSITGDVRTVGTYTFTMVADNHQTPTATMRVTIKTMSATAADK